jgi:hypothetical protein
MALQPNTGRGLPFWCFVTITFLQEWIISPAPNPQPGGPGLHIYDPRRRWPSYTARHWVHILVAFYDMRWLQWDCSLIAATTRDSRTRYLHLLRAINNHLVFSRGYEWGLFVFHSFIFSFSHRTFRRVVSRILSLSFSFFFILRIREQTHIFAVHPFIFRFHILILLTLTWVDVVLFWNLETYIRAFMVYTLKIVLLRLNRMVYVVGYVTLGWYKKLQQNITCESL